MTGLELRIVDDSRGRGAQGVPVTLERQGPGERRHVIGDGITGADGVVPELIREGTAIEIGRYCATIRLTAWFMSQDVVPLFPEIHVLFDLRDATTPLKLRVHVSPQAHIVVREP